MNHRGRFQAQGKRLDESEPWSQNEPLTIEDGLKKLGLLKNKIKPKDLRLRYEAFDECEKFINKASQNGGIDVTNFPYRYSKSWVVYDEERVDLEIHKGIPFIKAK
jgi:hypothetical protein